MSKPTPGIASAYAALSTVQIPDHWSAEQALAVWEFLEAIAGCIWDRYEMPLVELIRAELEHHDDNQLDLFDFNDDLPF